MSSGEEAVRRALRVESYPWGKEAPEQPGP